MILKTKFVIPCLLILLSGLLIVIYSSFNDRLINEENYRWIKPVAGLNLRESPHTTAKIITLIPYGNKVKTISEYKKEIVINNIKGKWVNISWNDKTGWVFDGYLTSDNLFRKNICRISAKQGLPFYTIDSYSRFSLSNDVIPYNTIVKVLKQDIYFDYSIITWNNKEYKVHSGFLASPESNKNQIPHDLNTFIQSDNKIYQKKGDFAIKNIGTYYLLTVLSTMTESGKWGFYDYLLKKENNKWKLFDIYNCGRKTCYIRLFDINNNNYPDVIAYGGCCNHSYFKIYTSHDNKVLKETLSLELSPTSSYYDIKQEDHIQVISLGQCSNTKITYKRQLYVYDCEKNKLIKK